MYIYSRIIIKEWIFWIYYKIFIEKNHFFLVHVSLFLNIDKELFYFLSSFFVILVEYPKADIKNDFMTEVNNFVRNESAAFAEFKAEEAYKALEESLDNNM